MRAALIIAQLTIAEATRKRLLAAVAILGTAFVALYATGLHFIHLDLVEHGLSPQQRQLPLNGITLAALYVANFLIVMVAALLAIDSLAGEIDSGTIDSLCVRPLGRSTILLGKWLGGAVLLMLYAGGLCGGVLLFARLLADFSPPGTAVGLPLILLSGLIMMTIALAGGARLSPLANGVVCLGLYGLAFLGGWTEQIGSLVGNSSARYVGILASLAIPCEALWQLAAHHMQPSWMQQVGITPFTPTSVPSPSMVAWALGHLAAVFLLADRLFHTRDL